MTQKIEALELRRIELHRRLQEIGDFRRGTVSANLRKCGKRNCVCAEAGHAGHPQFLWNTTRASRSEARSLRLGPQVEKYEREVDNYRLFLEITRELVDINEKIDEFRERGLFIGSGVVEAGCKTVIGRRLKQSGMRWTVRGATPLSR